MNLGSKKAYVGIGVALVILVALVFGAINLYSSNKEKEEVTQVNNDIIVDGVKDTSNNKYITIDVINIDGTKQTYGVETDKQFLGEVVREVTGLTVEGDQTVTGLFVKTVNGVYADYNVNQTYWAFYVNDQYCQTGVDTQPVANGDKFKIVQESSYVPY